MYFNPDHTISAAMYIKEILADRRISIKDLSGLTSFSEVLINEILQEKVFMSYEQSFWVSEALNIDQEIFIQLDENYLGKQKKSL